MESTNLTLHATTSRGWERKPLHEVTIGSVRVSHTNKAQARAAAAKALQGWLDSYQAPIVVHFRTTVAVLVLLPSTDDSVLVDMVAAGARSTGEAFSHQLSNREHSLAEARAHALYHLVGAWVDYFDDDTVWTGVAALPHSQPDSVEDFTAEALLRYVGWQRAYRHREESGTADPHTYASDYQGRFIPGQEATP